METKQIFSASLAPSKKKFSLGKRKKESNPKNMAGLQQNNAYLGQLLTRKELCSDCPVLTCRVVFLLILFHGIVFFEIDVALWMIATSFLLFLLLTSFFQRELPLFHEILGKKAMELGCPLCTKYENHRGQSGYYTYVYVNKLAFRTLLTLRCHQNPPPFTQEVLQSGGFYKKYLVEFVGNKVSVGKTIADFESRPKVKGFCLPSFFL